MRSPHENSPSSIDAAPILASSVDGELVLAEPIEPPAQLAASASPQRPPISLPPRVAQMVPEPIRGPLLGIVRGIALAIEWLFGAVALIGGLGILATIPVLQLLSLGYLLEVGGRIARTGQVRAGFVGIRKAAHLGSIVLCTWFFLWPLKLLADLHADARLIDPASSTSRLCLIALVSSSIAIGLHVASACLRGGRLRHFLWPRPIATLRILFRRGWYGKARDAVWSFVDSLRLPYYMWLGVRGFFGGLLLLAVPVSMLALGREFVPAGILGGAWLFLVVIHLPFLQAQFALHNRLRELFNFAGVWQTWARAPIAGFLALLFTLALALPLYALKIEIIPREAAFLPSLFFVISIFPARMLSGWALARAAKRDRRRHLFVAIVSVLLMLPVTGIYVLIVYFTQYVSWHGIWSLYEQHAFLVPRAIPGNLKRGA